MSNLCLIATFFQYSTAAAVSDVGNLSPVCHKLVQVEVIQPYMYPHIEMFLEVKARKFLLQHKSWMKDYLLSPKVKSIRRVSDNACER